MGRGGGASLYRRVGVEKRSNPRMSQKRELGRKNEKRMPLESKEIHSQKKKGGGGEKEKERDG